MKRVPAKWTFLAENDIQNTNPRYISVNGIVGIIRYR